MSSNCSERPDWIEKAGMDYTSARFGSDNEPETCTSSTCDRTQLLEENARLQSLLWIKDRLLDQSIATMAKQGDGIKVLESKIAVYDQMSRDSDSSQYTLFDIVQKSVEMAAQMQQEIERLRNQVAELTGSTVEGTARTATNAGQE